MTLTGILKNILLVGASVMIWNNTISFLQFLGYGVALAGLVYYSIGWDQIKNVAGATAMYGRALVSPAGDENRFSPAVRRGVLMGVAFVIVVFVMAGMFYGHDETLVRPAA